MEQREVWNAVAWRWRNWRNKPREIAVQLANEWVPGRILDIGCGNCRNLVPFLQKGFSGVGIDFSEGMLKHSHELLKKNKVSATLKLGSSERLPFERDSFDYCLFIAALHHLNKEGQKKALAEMGRVLKPEGLALITVWNKWQWEFVFGKKERMIPWKTKEVVYDRYYYFFNYFELRKMLRNEGFDVIKSYGMFGDDVVFIVKKRESEK